MTNDAIEIATRKLASAFAEMLEALTPPAPRAEPKTKPPAPESLLMNERETLKLMNISRKSLYLMRKNKGFPFLPMGEAGGKIMYGCADVVRWIDEHKVRESA